MSFSIPSLSSASVLAVILVTQAALSVDSLRAEEPVLISEGEARPGGEVVHRVRSPFQPGETLIRVLRPEPRSPDEKFPLLLVLPVDVQENPRWGNGLQEILRHRIHEQYRLICVAPTFAQLPWYADHPTDPLIRQESYLLKVVLPFVDQHYPTTARGSERLLLGFSKSGWGAFSLLLRHPEQFGKAAAWDAPLMMETSGQYGSGPIFGTPENFQHYRLTTLLRSQAGRLMEPPRLFHLGYGNFREHHTGFEALLCELNIAHGYRHGPPRTHHWSSGWVPEAVQMLCRQP